MTSGETVGVSGRECAQAFRRCIRDFLAGVLPILAEPRVIDEARASVTETDEHRRPLLSSKASSTLENTRGELFGGY